MQQRRENTKKEMADCGFMKIVLGVYLFVVYLMTLNKSSYTLSDNSLITVQGIEKGVKEWLVVQFEAISRHFGSRA